MKEKIIAALKALGLFPDDKAKEIETQLDKLELDKKTDPPAPVNTDKLDPAVKQVIDGLTEQVKAITESNKQLQAALAEELKQRTQGIEAQKAQAKAAQEVKIKTAVDDAIKAGKYPEAQRDALTKMYNADFDSTDVVVKAAPVQKQFLDAANQGKDNKGGNDKPNVNARSPLDSAPVTVLKAIKDMDVQSQSA